MNSHALLAVLALAMFAPVAAAQQQFDRRSRDEPEIVVEAGGRFGTCDVLRFTPDGSALLAAGDDKVVRVWPYSAAGLETDRTKVRVLRWRAWREQRGGIKAADLSADGKRVVVGGYGMRPATVAILDRETGDPVALTWPRSRPGVDNFNTVHAVAFAPDGRRVAFGTADGSLWVWDPALLEKPTEADTREGRKWAAPVRAGKHEALTDEDGNEEFNFPRLIYLADDKTLVSVAQSGQVLACDLGGKLSDNPADPPPAGKTLFNVNDGLAPGQKARVYRTALTPDRTWLVAATTSPHVLLRSTDGKSVVRLPLPADHFPRSIAVHPKTGQLAVGVGAALPGAGNGPRFYAEGNDEIWLFDHPTAGGEPKPAAKLAHRGPAEALAFHPDGRLAIAGGDADEVTLLDPARPEKPVSVVRGAGRRPWAVNLTENGKVIGVQVGRDATATDPNARGTGHWTRFELTRLTPTPDESQAWVGPTAHADGWTVEPDPSDRFVWYARRAGAKVRLALDRHRDSAPTCYTFLPAKDGKPTRLIVGHLYGCSLFELTPDRVVKNKRTGAPELFPTKIYTGHGGDVTSVVAAKDQSWFLTGGADQTLAGWSLADWRHEPGLGAAFAVKDGRVEVTGLAIGSPAWEAGLRVGDRIDLLAVDGNLLFDRRPGRKEVGSPEGAMAALKAPRPRVELFFGWLPKGKAAKDDRRESLTTVRQRPMWKWFPGFNDRGRMDDWVIWMWHGSYYYTTTAHGDRLVGWHVNDPEVGGRPEFYQLQQLQKRFFRPEVIEKLVNTADVAAALTDALGDNPILTKFTDLEPAPVRIGLRQSVLGPGGATVTVTIRPRGSNPDLLPERVELWLNDYRLRVWSGRGKVPLEEEVAIPADRFRAGENQLTVQTFNPAGGRADAFQLVVNPKDPPRPNLRGLAVGINDYSANRRAAGGARGFDDLASATKDAQGLTEKLLTYRGAGRFFPAGDIRLLLNREAAREKLLASLKGLEGEANPDDILVVFFAGHGDLPEAPERPAASRGARGIETATGPFVFCLPEYNRKALAKTALSAEELFDALARINCRKVVLLDACHSGQAVEANVLRRFVPNGHGPFVIAASDASEPSFEDPKLGHGLFTYALLDALGDDFRKADENSDGALSAEELFRYVGARMPDLLREVGKPQDAQNPIAFPRDPPKFTVVRR
jgi:WD40 repeat protein